MLALNMCEITSGIYFIFLDQTIRNSQAIGDSALSTINNSILVIYHSRDENDNMSTSGAAVLLKFDTLITLENCIKAIYY